jgi:hypothetical protein
VYGLHKPVTDLVAVGRMVILEYHLLFIPDGVGKLMSISEFNDNFFSSRFFNGLSSVPD